jgi:hypothetical protein
MGIRKLMFPIGLAIVWVLLMAMAMADFAGFSAATKHSANIVADVGAMHSTAARRTARTAVRD